MNLKSIDSGELELAKKLFGSNVKKFNNTNQLVPNPLVLFCKDKKYQRFSGEQIDGFSNEFCDGFFPTPTDVGFCMTKNMDIRKILNKNPLYWNFMEADKQVPITKLIICISVTCKRCIYVPDVNQEKRGRKQE